MFSLDCVIYHHIFLKNSIIFLCTYLAHTVNVKSVSVPNIYLGGTTVTSKRGRTYSSTLNSLTAGELPSVDWILILYVP